MKPSSSVQMILKDNWIERWDGAMMLRPVLLSQWTWTLFLKMEIWNLTTKFKATRHLGRNNNKTSKLFKITCKFNYQRWMRNSISHILNFIWYELTACGVHIIIMLGISLSLARIRFDYVKCEWFISSNMWMRAYKISTSHFRSFNECFHWLIK